jgi:hypothetical protein
MSVTEEDVEELLVASPSRGGCCVGAPSGGCRKCPLDLVGPWRFEGSDEPVKANAVARFACWHRGHFMPGPPRESGCQRRSGGSTVALGTARIKDEGTTERQADPSERQADPRRGGQASDRPRTGWGPSGQGPWPGTPFPESHALCRRWSAEHSMPLNQVGGSRRTRRPVMCAVPTAPAGLQRAELRG